jgi:hypothetical protein
LAEPNSGIVEWLLGCRGPKVDVVSGHLALETLEGVLGEIDREHTAFCGSRLMQRTRAAQLVGRRSDRSKTEQAQDFAHGEDGSQLAKVDAGHAPPRNREEEPVVKSMN